jgi:hypothetical protein
VSEQVNDPIPRYRQEHTVPTDTSSTFADDLLAPVRHSTTPLLVWHGAGGERVELSGRVFDNWVAKTANLLVEELDVEQGRIVELDLPAHWKSLALALGVLQTGAALRLPAGGSRDGDAVASAAGGGAAETNGAEGETVGTGPVGAADRCDVVVSHRPLEAARRAPGAAVVSVALGSLALGFDGEAPAGALDYAAEVRAFGDYFLADAVPGGSVALAAPSTATYAELFGAPAQSGTALLAGAGLEAALRAAVVLWRGGGTLVLLDGGVEATERLLASERVERTLEA